ncbi:hypothetical protein BIV57_05565 [Mangrovactinospora gilvigrisea]|uniref:Esterase n=1 Tax=Mangrovactinospora gilvigrisea TaxID=1428644 RepID=A0A1J7BIH9_9ACTN|nr:alpha/beta hydrolase-fold protein [Mangrovactinospora gilvigrisea]OIV38471.1 hypothetical protein BIV57_05565 [Mangrovactinospora gilvigrisea]
MGLTAKKFVLLLILIAIGLIVLTVWLWPRLARRGPAMVAGRVGMLVACQLAIVSAFAAAVNADFMFYTSWSDLLGTQHDTAKISQVTAGAKARHLVVTGHQAVRYQGKNAPAQTGRIDNVTIRGAVSGLSETGYVYLPPQYFAHGAEKKRFPVVVQLTGYPGEAVALIKKMKLPEYQLRGLAAHTAKPMIYVMIRSATDSRDTECTDVPGGPHALQFLSQDVPRAVREGYRTAPDAAGWAMAGDSTGGYCALKIAMTSPDRFGSAVALSAYFHALQDPTTGSLYDGSRKYRAENDLVWRLKHLPSPPVQALLTTSRTEADYKQTLAFARLARQPMGVTTLVRDQGGHNFNTWTQEIPHTMHWLAGRLKVTAQP